MGDLTAAMCYLLTRAHFAGLPTTRTLWSHVSYALDAAKDELSPQDLVVRALKACVQHPLNNSAPRDPKHNSSVWQWLVKVWQERGWPLPEVLASGDLEEPTDCPELCYKTYVGWGVSNFSGGGDNFEGVTLLESSGGIIHHTTGLTTWGGAAILANWVTDNPQMISGRRVLELGAGVGFTASVILTSSDEEHPPPISYVATDCHHHVLTLLHHNLELNLSEEPMKRTELEAFQEATGRILVSEEVQSGQILPWNPPSAHLRLSPRSRDLTDTDDSWQCSTRRGTQVEVLQVDWRHPCHLPDVDVIVAADVVYAHHLIPPLVALIKSILTGTASKPATKKTKVKRGQRSKSGSLKENGMIKKKSIDETDVKIEESLSKLTTEIEDQEAAAKGKEEEEEKQEEESEGRRKLNGESDEAVERVAYIACTRRTHETMTVFLEEVAKQGLVHSLIYQATLDTDTFLFLYNETHLPVKIYKLGLPQETHS